jgi:hypothetical protein
MYELAKLNNQPLAWRFVISRESLCAASMPHFHKWQNIPGGGGCLSMNQEFLLQPQGLSAAVSDNPASTTGILFLGLARDCAQTLPGFFAYLRQLEASGFSCSAIIGENGSRDATRALIEQAVGPRISLVDTAIMAHASSLLSRMATGRQALLNAALARGLSEEFVCVVDLDNVMTAPPPAKAVGEALESLRSNPALFAIGATSRPVYYDLASLRAEGFEFLSSFNCALQAAKKKPWSYYHFHQQHIYRIQKRMTVSVPVLCASSFNGFCVYRASDYRLGSYRASDEAEVCEHVNFNLSLVRGTDRKMMISPTLVLASPANHQPVGLLRFWSDRLKKKLSWLG